MRDWILITLLLTLGVPAIAFFIYALVKQELDERALNRR